MNNNYQKKIRIAKFLSNKGYGSRREIEQLIQKKRILVNKELISSPITFVNNEDEIIINNKKIDIKKKLEVWKFYKPLNYITSRNKQDDRPIIYDLLPFNRKKIKTVGRLDINSEGLLLLTDDGEIIRNLELPKNKFIRKYKIRVYGYIDETSLDRISRGVKINNILYAPFEYKLLKKGNANSWVEFHMREGKNNEIRNLCAAINLKVNRLIRLEYGPFKLKNLLAGKVEKAEEKEMRLYEDHIRKI
jgi:23S rRNA pseudouridine2605 synthase